MLDAQQTHSKMEPTGRLNFVIDHVAKNNCMGGKKMARNVTHLESKQWQYSGVHLSEKDDKGYPVDPAAAEPADIPLLCRLVAVTCSVPSVMRSCGEQHGLAV